jgi:mannonate dehydratase
MKRREFARKLATGVAGASLTATGPCASASPRVAVPSRKNVLMHVGGDYHSVAGQGITSPQNLQYNLRYGAKHLTAQVAKKSPDGAWDRDELMRMKDNCDRFGVELEAIRMDPGYIQQRPGPSRDHMLAAILANIQLASAIGIKYITYHWTVIPIRRNEHRSGRGGSTYTGFTLEHHWQDLPVGKAGKVASEDYWERIGYFLEKAVPVAKQFNVRLACHPYDPPGLPLGYQGADNWDSPDIFTALKRYESLVDSPYNGFQLCLGTTAEGLRDPRHEVLPIVQYLGERGKIYQIHMRNIRGGLDDFAEVYPDEGEMDFFQVMRVLRDTQFAGSIFPDHMPDHPDDPGRLQSYAFGYGYIHALIQAVNSEVRA